MVFLLILISLILPPPSMASPYILSRGASLNVEADSDVLISPNKDYTCGFFKVGSNAYTFSIWFSNSANKTKVWSANQDRPVNGHCSRVTMTKDGRLVLTDIGGEVAWSTNTSSTQADRVELLNSGNLVVKDGQGSVLWQSFGSPTDTLLPTQPITKNSMLVSGYYRFYFDNDNVLKLIYDGPEISSIYWPDPDKDVWNNLRTYYNSTRYGVLDEKGEFIASDRLAFNASDMGIGVLRRLTLDNDGNLRLYSLNNSTGLWSVTWAALSNLCLIHGLCGKNGICLYTESEACCSCPPNFEMADASDWRKGCKRNFNINCDKPDELTFMELPKTDFWGFDINVSNKWIQHSKTSAEVTAGNRVGVPRVQKLSCNDSEVQEATGTAVTNGRRNSRAKWIYYYSFLSAFGVIEILFIVTGWLLVFRRDLPSTQLEKAYTVISSQFRKFTYKELEKATKNFKEELGRGGSGVVYKGILDDERAAAVNKLEDVSQGEEEFQAELSLIGRIYHMNLVRMWGFCSQGSRRLLVSEYVENGALDKHLFCTGSMLGWGERFKIAVGVARGLAYLHHECLEWVVHCDVKPENILLDSDFEPKIADLGLAKLLNRGGVGSRISRARGTRGYMAPEWATSLPITSKVDVFSYGMVLIELIRGVRVWNGAAADEEETEGAMELMRLVRTGKERMESGEESWIGEIVDGRLNGQFNCRRAEMMVEIAVSCLEEDRSRRPDMGHVLQMLVSADSFQIE